MDSWVFILYFVLLGNTASFSSSDSSSFGPWKLFELAPGFFRHAGCCESFEQLSVHLNADVYVGIKINYQICCVYI